MALSGYVGARFYLRRKYEARLRAAKNRLVQNAQHGIKNSLQVTSSLIRQSLRDHRLSIAGGEVLSDLNGRIVAVGRLHSHLVARDDTLCVEFCAFLSELASEYDWKGELTVEFAEPPNGSLFVDVSTGVAVGLLVAECFTEISDSGERGEIRVSCALEGGVLTVDIGCCGTSSPELFARAEDWFERPPISDLMKQTGAAFSLRPEGGDQPCDLEIRVPISGA
ncbi:MAG: histidine kinase dimerization/phosphoacceptor domain -containing protein [Pseudomonadota bacterium]